MNKKRALSLAREWAQGHRCTLRDGEASEYHAMFASMLEKSTPNKLLTLEQLRQMDGDPVYIPEIECWALVKREQFTLLLTFSDGKQCPASEWYEQVGPVFSRRRRERGTIMTKCYEHEECEFNGQPECRLPDGMECPHGAKADKPVAESKTDIEALIERLNQYSQSLIAYQMGGEFSDLCVDAATVLSTLQDAKEKLYEKIEDARLEGYAKGLGEMSEENEKLRAELEQVKKCIEIVEFQRDAAINQLHGHCPACTHYTPNHNEGPCRTCKHEYYHLLNNESLDNWEWRGPQKED